MEQVLGRNLLDTEIVHHKDEDGLNNDPSNLEVMTQSEHQHEHLMIGPSKWNLDNAIHLREAGWTFDMIAAQFDVTSRTIMDVFRRRGMDTKDKRHGTVSWDIEKALLSYSEGQTIVAIAKAAGVSSPSVRKAFIRLDVYQHRARKSHATVSTSEG